MWTILSQVCTVAWADKEELVVRCDWQYYATPLGYLPAPKNLQACLSYVFYYLVDHNPRFRQFSPILIRSL